MSLIEQIASIANYQFMLNAYFAAFVISFILPLIGVLIIQRKMTFMADALGHINMAGMTFAYLLSPLITVSFFQNELVLATAWAIGGAVLTEYISTNYRQNKDIALMIIYSLNIALMMIFLNLSSGFSNNLITNLLFGNINALTTTDVVYITVVVAIALIILSKIFAKLLLVTFDETTAKVSGIKYTRLKYIFIILTTIVITVMIKMVGVLLVSSLLILPVVSSYMIAKSLKQALKISILITEVSLLLGITIGYLVNISASAIVVLINIGFYLVFSIVSKYKKSN